VKHLIEISVIIPQQDLPEYHFHRFLDEGPEFDVAEALIEQYLEIEGAEVEMTVLDAPDITHPGSTLWH
jgi:hypothetical protein